MRDEAEAHGLVKHHLEREIDGGDVTVLSRNNSDDRLDGRDARADGDSPLAAGLDGRRAGRSAWRCGWRAPTSRARTRSAPPLRDLRQAAGRGHVRAVAGRRRGDRLGAGSAASGRSRPTSARGSTDSVAQAAPVLANLRNLAIAETRAATDALTGLPNARSCTRHPQADGRPRGPHASRRSRRCCSTWTIQADQRPLRPRRRRRRPRGRRPDVLRSTRARQRLRGPLRRRGVPAAAARHRPGGRARGRPRRSARAIAGSSTSPSVERAITASLGIATYPLDATRRRRPRPHGRPRPLRRQGGRAQPRRAHGLKGQSL